MAALSSVNDEAGRRRLHRAWTQDDRDVRFARALGPLLFESGLAEEFDVLNLIGIAIRRSILKYSGLEPSLASEVTNLELDRASNEAWTLSRLTEFARQIRLVVVKADRTSHVTPCGEVLARLTGRDALRWLLAVEVEQSTGPYDPWRVDTGTVLDPPIVWHYDERDVVSWEQIHHLEELGLLTSEESEGSLVIDTTWLWQECSAVAKRDSAMRLHARALLEDETLSVMTRGELSRNTAAAATARQARLVAHEIRNALPPAREAFRLLYESLSQSDAQQPLDEYAPTIEKGFSRVFQFVEEILRLSETSQAPPEPFRLRSAIEDAILQANGGSLAPSVAASDSIVIEGYRERLVLGLANLLRNARQAGAQAIAISVHGRATDVVIHVDDDGPGVERERRDALFGAGGGHGLRLVREVIEEDHGGSISCVDSPLGGARFTIVVPAGGGTH